MSEFSLSQELISPEVYDAVVEEIGRDAGDLLAAVEATNYCYDSDPERFIKCEHIKMEPNSQQSEQENYNEDQKNFIPWNGQQQYEQYGDPGQVMYAQPSTLIVPQIPANVDYAGHLDFDILITSHIANRNSWIYSQMLNKVFINMQNILPVDVKRNATSAELYLRATLLYSLPQFAQDLVERCSTHVDPRLIANRDTDPAILKHVLRCTNPGSAYMGNADRKEHLSVVTQLAQPQAGVETVRVNYQFMCKNSCPSGMNRRAVDVIFTLEDGCGLVLGRRKLSVRVCSCPKRDKEKEEKEFRDSLQAQHPAPHGRKRKMPMRPKSSADGPVEDGVCELPALKVMGRDNAIFMLTVGRDRMLSDMHYKKMDVEQEALHKECVQKFNALLSEF